MNRTFKIPRFLGLECTQFYKNSGGARFNLDAVAGQNGRDRVGFLNIFFAENANIHFLIIVRSDFFKQAAASYIIKEAHDLFETIKASTDLGYTLEAISEADAFYASNDTSVAGVN